MKMNSSGQDKTSKDQTEANLSELPLALPLPPTKTSRRHASTSTLAFQSSTPTESAVVPRHSRRNKSTENATFEPLEQDKSARRGARKHNRVKENESDASQDTSLVPKPRRRKKSTRSVSEDGSGRLSAKTDLGQDQWLLINLYCKIITHKGSREQGNTGSDFKTSGVNFTAIWNISFV